VATVTTFFVAATALSGEAGGDDLLYGGNGNDTLGGGDGKKNLTVNGVSQLDQISDFTQGQDKVHLSAIDANPNLAGDQAFTFISDPAHNTGDWTGVVWQTTAANGVVTINVSIDGNADPEMQINMAHPYQFTVSDFIL
jgi:serralysin